jgi:heme-degrading monooxygenase HmoA
MSEFHLAQLNIARMLFTQDDPAMRDFMDALEPVNAVADDSAGFVWRLQSEEGDTTAEDVFGGSSWLVNMSVWESLDALKAFISWLVNMSVWESLDALKEFIRSPGHLAIMRRRSEWFEKVGEAYTVLWWVPAGHLPEPEEAHQRLQALRSDGPTPQAFSFSQPYPPPSA